MSLLSMSAIALMLLLGVAFSFFVFTQIDQTGRAHILERTATIAVATPLLELSQLTGTDADLGTPSYEAVKSYLVRMRSVNHDARFLYLIGENTDGSLFFYADSEPAESADYSPPGQVYYEASPGMVAILEDGKPRTEGPDRDRWGIWISGYTPVYDPEGNIVAMLGMDLPASRYLADVLAYSVLPLLIALALTIVIVAMDRARARERGYLEQKAEFLSIASHEIRTPLTGIRWAIEGLLKRENPPLDPKSRSILVLVHESCLGLIGRVNNLLDLTALEGKRAASLRMERIEALPFIEDIIDSLALSARQRHVSLTANVAPEVVFMGDRQMMHHAFFNLLTNAIKYTREGTEVTVSYAHEAGMHVFRVADSGEGIPPEDQERIFAGYHRTRDAIRSGQYGTGLGLFLVKKAAELHGGTVSVQSMPGKGATFTVSIPERTTIS